MARPAAYLHIDGFDSYGKLDFDKKEIRKAMRRAGTVVRGEARKLVGKKGGSSESASTKTSPSRCSGLTDFKSVWA